MKKPKVPELFDNTDPTNKCAFIGFRVHIQEMEMNKRAIETATLKVFYNFENGIFGPYLIASTDQGICYLSFYSDPAAALNELYQNFASAVFVRNSHPTQQSAVRFFQSGGIASGDVFLHLRGTSFQFKVWQSLLRIPFGQLTNYQSIALEIGQKKAARAVGTAIGSNRVAFFIPCHRVLPLAGGLGGYKWGSELKKMLIAWEQSAQY